MKKIPLAVRAQKCSFSGTTNKREVLELATEIISSSNEKELKETISMPLMDSSFVELALTRLVLLKLVKNEIEDSVVKLKIPKKSFTPEILGRFPEGQQINLPLGKIISKGEYLFLFVESNGFVENIVRVIFDSTDYFSKS